MREPFEAGEEQPAARIPRIAFAASITELFLIVTGTHPSLYEHLGYGECTPMLRPDGTPYPQDEDDDA